MKNLLPLVERPFKTAADFMAAALCPALIMTLVGSLVLFLLEASYSGPWLRSMRWTLCWFTLAIVLVSRIAIERTPQLAIMYGLALAGATTAFLVFRFGFVVPVWILLGVVWWAADRLTRDCTLIDDDADFSGAGLIQPSTATTLGLAQSSLVKAVGPAPNQPSASPPSTVPTGPAKPAKRAKRPPKKQSIHAPGLWILYFAIAAIPLFGAGEILLPALQPAARRLGFILMLVYLASSVTLLVLTSFLGLRRYLRQRYLQMPTGVAVGWVRTGISMVVVLLLLAIVLPRPVTSYSLDRLVNQPLPNGPGGRAGGEDPSDKKDLPGQNEDKPKPGDTPSPKGKTDGKTQGPKPGPAPNSESLSLPSWFDWISWLAALALLLYMLIRFWPEILAAWRAFLESLRARRKLKPKLGLFRRTPQPDSAPRFNFSNPFQNGMAARMDAAELIRYSYDAARAWAALRGSKPEDHETPVEFAERLVRREPALTREIQLLSRYYSHLAYAGSPPPPECLAVLQKLWSVMTFNPVTVARGEQWG